MIQVRHVLIIAALFCGFISYTQKKVEETIGAKGIKGILITSDQIFKIDVLTVKTTKINLKSEISGETFETLGLRSEIKNGVLEITLARSPFFKDIDDKLAAHKVMSIVLEITMPEGLELWVESSMAAVTLQGVYDLIELNLGRGDCQLNNFQGSGAVNTLSGNIDINTQNCAVQANSRHGKEDIISVDPGSSHLELKSITGDITVTQSE